MFAILSDLVGLPEPLVIGSSFKTLPNMNTSTGQYYPRVVEFDAYPGYDGVAQQVLPPDYIIKDCKKVGIYGTTEGKIGLCVSAPGIFFPETERREPRDSWFAVTCGEVLLAQVQTKGILAGAFSGTLPMGSFGEDYHSEDENELSQDMPNWKGLSIAKQIMLEYAVTGEKGGVYDLLDTTQVGDPDIVELEVNLHPSAPMAQNPSMPSETAGLPREEGDGPQPTGGWAAVRDGWNNRRTKGNVDPSLPSPHWADYNPVSARVVPPPSRTIENQGVASHLT